MSSRAIRRLRQEQLDAEESSLPPIDDDDIDEEDVPKGGFLDMLQDDDSSEEESSEEESSSASDGASPEQRPLAKPKNDRIKPQEEDIDDILSSFQDTSSTPVKKEIVQRSLTVRSLLLSSSHGFDMSALDLDQAVKSLLGGAVVGGMEEGQRRRKKNGRGRTVKRYLFGRPRETWGKVSMYLIVFGIVLSLKICVTNQYSFLFLQFDLYRFSFASLQVVS